MIDYLGIDTSYGYQRLPMLETISLVVKAELTMLMLIKFLIKTE
jgi:hypothetical protein